MFFSSVESNVVPWGFESLQSMSSLACSNPDPLTLLQWVVANDSVELLASHKQGVFIENSRFLTTIPILFCNSNFSPSCNLLAIWFKPIKFGGVCVHRGR
jgi:hypothetical protein